MKKFFFIWTVIALSSCSMSYLYALSKSSVNFNFDQTELIMAEDSVKSMKLWLVTDKKEYKLLRRKAKNVMFSKEDEVLHHFIQRLYATVTDTANAGVGIAAPQVGISKNIIWVQRFDKIDYPFEVYINPEITYYSEQRQPCREGCLSIPNRSDTLLVRSEEIQIEYFNKIGEFKKEKVSGFTAVIFQHEIDHLNGVLYTDYLD